MLNIKVHIQKKNTNWFLTNQHDNIADFYLIIPIFTCNSLKQAQF